MKLTSPAFIDGGFIPQKYACDGEDISPPLNWEGIPTSAESLVLICDDPDAPQGGWVHWLAFDIPADAAGLPEKVLPERDIPIGGRQGINGFQVIGYRGPCPPSGEHRYFFKLYALKRNLNLAAGLTKPMLVIAMEGLILDQCVLMGRYRR
jgi:Raf kinase inhibitor-like YbhB/YbcL family protein